MTRVKVSFLTTFICTVLLALSQAASAQISVNDTALMQARPAKLLSAYGLFSSLRGQTPSQRVHPYDLQQALFSDYAVKYRFVYLPFGTRIQYHATEAFDFPIGSVLVKTFAYPADFRKPQENIRLLETRLLIRQEKGWNAWAYVWNDAQTDAVLKVAGKTLPVSWVDAGGQPQNIQYVVPNKNQCKGCHSLNKTITPIGPKARNLNRSYTYAAGAKNQLLYWSENMALDNAPTLANAPSVFAFSDTVASVEKRTRAYLDINCAHCHRAEGPASNSGLFLTYGEDVPVKWGLLKRPVAAGRGSGGFLFDIDPGHADKSILLYRILSTDPGIMMPEVGRSVVHTEGAALIREWINSLEKIKEK
ncbi:MAG: hypothetical protein COB37_03825 [Kordiimonadales bacterium]|nr:MAG: hypothetical protein COB37_03825 [Kordiimonadales bacterium]